MNKINQFRMLILDGPPDYLFFSEINDFLNKGFELTINTNTVRNCKILKKTFKNKINYVNFDNSNERELIHELIKNKLGYHVIKLRRPTRINLRIISKASSFDLKFQLKVIAQTGVGINHIDCKAASKYKVFVTNTPGSNANSVAEFVIALMLILSRNIIYHNNKGHEGHWSHESIGLRYFELKGKNLGIIGVGNIAKRLIEKAKALKMNIITYNITPKNNIIIPRKDRISEFKKFLSSADFISIHTPLSKKTKDLISKNELRHMKKGSFLINTARGGIVNETALARELKRKNRNIYGAAIDVHIYEDSKYKSPLIGLNNVIITPHIAGTTFEALAESSRRLSENIAAILCNNYNVTIVNREILDTL